MTEAGRILLVRPSALGDVCRTVPVLASLRRRFPDARIDWLVRDDFAGAVAAHPALDEVVPFPRRRFGRWWRRPGAAREAIRWLNHLRDRRYDLVFDCQGLARSGLFTWATRAPRRVGFADAPEFAWLGCNRRHHVSRDLHVVDRMLALIEQEGVPPTPDMRLYTTPEARAAIESRLRGRSFAVVAPTSAWPAKRWPVDRYRSLVRRLLDQSLADAVVIVGAAGERDQCAPALDVASQDDRLIDLVGATTVDELMAVIEASSLVVANDSAAMHMAVGFDRPLVALLGPTDASLAGPYRRPDAVVQRLEPGDRLTARASKDEPRGLEMMQRITVEDALETCRAALTREGRRTHEAASSETASAPRKASV